jgi:hypothetical protein
MKPSIYEPTLRRESPILYLPASGANVTGRGLGPDWDRTGAGTVTHPTPTATFLGQFPRTRVTSAASQNNELGVHLPNASDARLWRGNATSRGGFFFSTQFIVNAILNNNVRLFAGVSAQTGTGVCISNTVPANTVGLWCDDADGANLTIVTTDNAAAKTKTVLKNASGVDTPLTLAAGVLYEFVMICNPNQAVIVTYIVDISADTLLRTQNVGSTMPLNTAMLAPQVGLSNAQNAAGNDHSFDVISIYARPNLRLTPLGTP